MIIEPMERALIVSANDLEEQLSRPNGGCLRFLVFIRTLASFVKHLHVVTFSRSLLSPERVEDLRLQLQQLAGKHITLEVLQSVPVQSSTWRDWLAPIFSYGSHPEVLRFSSRETQERLTELFNQEWSSIVVRSMSLAGALLRNNRKSARNWAVDVDDIDHKKFLRMVRCGEIWGRKYLLLAQFPARMFFDFWVLRSVRKSLICSELDRSYLARIFRLNSSKLAVIPNSVPARSRLPVPESKVMLFVGDCRYAPNASAVKFFLTMIFPDIKRRCPDAEFWVVGLVTEALRSLIESVPGVSALGFVEDLDSVYEQARFVVCPILSGGGTRIKIIEAASFGRTIVSTTLGAEGLNFSDGSGLFLANDEKTFSDICCRLLDDSEMTARHGASAYQHCASSFFEDRISAMLRGLWEVDDEDYLRIPSLSYLPARRSLP